MGLSTKAGEEESQLKGKGVKERRRGGVDESASLPFVVQMSVATVTASWLVIGGLV